MKTEKTTIDTRKRRRVEAKNYVSREKLKYFRNWLTLRKMEILGGVVRESALKILKDAIAEFDEVLK